MMYVRIKYKKMKGRINGVKKKYVILRSLKKSIFGVFLWYCIGGILNFFFVGLSDFFM